MEIADYLRIAKRRAAILIAVPLLAGGLAVADVVTALPSYTATAYVSGSALAGEETGAYGGPQGVEHFVNDIMAAATTGAVARKAAEKTGVPADAISGNVEAERSGEGSQVELTYTTTDQAKAKPVVTAVAAASLKNMFGPSVDVASARADLAQGSLRDAGSAVRKFEANHPTVAASPGAASPETRAKYEALLAKQSAARSSVSSALRSLAEAKAQFTAADALDPTKGTVVSQDPVVPRALQKGLPAAGTGLFLAIGLVALLELLFPHRRPSRRAASRSPSDNSEPTATGPNQSTVLRDWVRP